jgi:hypothetical protein
MLILGFDLIVAAADGKTLETEAEWNALRGQVVVVAPSGGKIDPVYAKLLRKETVTIQPKPGGKQPDEP